MTYIKKLILHNYKRYTDFTVEFDESLNILIGDNEAGKSSILNAIDIVLSGSKSKVEALGLESLFNIDIIKKYLSSNKSYHELPKLFIEVYLSEQDKPDTNGKYNSINEKCDGLILECAPIDDLGIEIKEILKQDESNFPFEYYSIHFKTFSGESYTGYRRFLKHILIDNSQISNEYATKQYIKSMYSNTVKDSEKHKHQNEYRKHKHHFKDEILTDINGRLERCDFDIRTSSKSNLETDLIISEDDINIENKGKGKQCFIKTEFALQARDNNLDVVLIEEPENHLSHINMKKLITKIRESSDKQLFVATHNNLICSRLDLRKAILLSSNSQTPVLLRDLPESTAKYFMKAPNNNILEFILSKKNILVEGDAEYILMNSFYENIAEETLETSYVNILSVGGTRFKRYLDIAKLLDIQTAVITDNDKDYQKNCVDKYSTYSGDFFMIFSDHDNTRYTFEVTIYKDNTDICEELFSVGRTTLSVQDYMLKYKTDVAYRLLDEKADEINVPMYIKDAIEWIKE